MITLEFIERSLRQARARLDRQHDINGVHQIAQTIPIGTVIEYAGSTVPDGWLELDGSLQSRTQYEALFKVIGVQGGAGNGTTTFQLPTEASVFTLNKLIFTGVE